MLIAALVLVAAATATAAPISNITRGASRVAEWEELRRAIDGFDLVENVAVSAGDYRGELFRHSKGTTGFETEMGIASATKWVSGVAVMAVVEAGLLSLDDPAFEWLE
jgi:CubicO group peptidase (beta-lactamase class C family)